jgi:hypothetical protein
LAPLPVHVYCAWATDAHALTIITALDATA